MAEANLSGQRRTVQLLGLFVAWKLALLAVVLLTPVENEGYDSSTQLLLLTRAGSSGPSDNPAAASTLQLWGSDQTLLQKLAIRLTRWDAIYFTSNAARGYVHEQDWAFSYCYTRVIHWLSKIVFIDDNDIVSGAITGIIVANLSHFLSSLVLQELVLLLELPRIAFVATVLHILSPAGVFLLAPYSEAAFALLSFIGLYLYARAANKRTQSGQSAQSDILVLLSGIVLGLATTVRGNGLFGGLIFAVDAAMWALRTAGKLVTLPPFLVNLDNGYQLPRIWAIILAGSMIAAGYALPQFVAYQDFCVDRALAEQAKWCNNIPPSIYTYIQEHYWKVGLFRYWTLSNIPLFLLAAPMLWVLITSSTASFSMQSAGLESKATNKKEARLVYTRVHVLSRLALPQLALAVVTLTTAHVQIVNRLASGYPLWYITLGGWITSSIEADRVRGKRLFILMVVYAVVQGALFAAFLPPA